MRGFWTSLRSLSACAVFSSATSGSTGAPSLSVSIYWQHCQVISGSGEQEGTRALAMNGVTAVFFWVPVLFLPTRAGCDDILCVLNGV